MKPHDRLIRLEKQIMEETKSPAGEGIIVVQPGESVRAAATKFKQDHPEQAGRPDKNFTVFKLVAPDPNLFQYRVERL